MDSLKHWKASGKMHLVGGEDTVKRSCGMGSVTAQLRDNCSVKTNIYAHAKP